MIAAIFRDAEPFVARQLILGILAAAIAAAHNAQQPSIGKFRQRGLNHPARAAGRIALNTADFPRKVSVLLPSANQDDYIRIGPSAAGIEQLPLRPQQTRLRRHENLARPCPEEHGTHIAHKNTVAATNDASSGFSGV